MTLGAQRPRPLETMKPPTARAFALSLFTCLAFANQPLAAQTVLADDIGPTHLGGDDGAITPNGQYGIIRENTLQTSARFYDMSTGALLTSVMSTGSTVSGVCQDAVVCTDTRAAVLGSSLMIFDLGLLPGNPLLAETSMGSRPRDLELTPDGTLLAVRGGHETPGPGPRMAIFDMNTGQELASTPGAPPDYPSSRHSFDVDSVSVTNDHAVFTSVVYINDTPTTRVTIFDLHPAGGGNPQVVYETRRADGSDQFGAPHDVAISPDGTHAAVRSELEVACYALSDAQSTQLWKARLAGSPGPFGNSALDSIEMSDTRIATISRQSNPQHPIGAQVDVFDMAGAQGFDRVLGDPHDLALDAKGQNLLVRTHLRLFHYDVGGWTPGSNLNPQSTAITLAGSHTSWGAGLDSVAVSGTRVVSLVRDNNDTNVYVHDFGSGTLQEIGLYLMPDRPSDLAITPSGDRCVVSGLASVSVIDMNTGEASLAHELGSSGWWPWCDGVVVNESHALAFGLITPNFAGWTSIIDLFDQPTNYCTSTPNSTGQSATIYANGSASVLTNDLQLWAEGLPVGQVGQFFYGSMAQSTPLGNGFLCLTGSPARFPLTPTFGIGVATQVVDNQALPIGGGSITAGTTWRFQFVYRDVAGGGSGFNLTDGLEILFGL